MGPLVTKQLRNSLCFLQLTVSSYAGNKCIQFNCKWVYTNSLLFVLSFYDEFSKQFLMHCDSSSYNEEKRQRHLWPVSAKTASRSHEPPLLLVYRGALPYPHMPASAPAFYTIRDYDNIRSRPIFCVSLNG